MPGLHSFWDALLACEGDVGRIVGVIARRAAEVVGEASIITRISDDGRVLEPVAVHHADPAVREVVERVLGSTPARVGHGIVGTVAADRRPVVLSNVDPAPLADLVEPEFRKYVGGRGVRSFVIVPLLAYGQVFGTLGVFRLDSSEPYTDEDVIVLEALAERAALALAEVMAHPHRVGAGEYEAIFRHTMEGILLTAPHGEILAANPAACEILRATEVEICRLGREGLVVGDDPRSQAALRQRAITGRVRAEIPMRRGDGSVFVADVTSTIFVNADDELRSCVFFRDVSEQVALRESFQQRSDELARLAEIDELTALHNRRGFVAAAERALSFADRDRVAVQVAFVDLNELKRINDTHGHAEGDAALVKVARAIESSVRAVDVAARIGGDEFAVLLYNANRADAEHVFQRVAAAVGDDDDGHPAVTFAVGLVERPAGSTTGLDDLLRLADEDMYLQKVRHRVLDLRDRDEAERS